LQKSDGTYFQEAQNYDVHGRVIPDQLS
jgi:hypothetical protein